MNKNKLAEILKYSSPKIIYVVTWNNILKKIFCPFKVKVNRAVGILNKGQIVWVEEVKVDLDLKTIFVINSKPYYHYHFDIII